MPSRMTLAAVLLSVAALPAAAQDDSAGAPSSAPEPASQSDGPTEGTSADTAGQSDAAQGAETDPAAEQEALQVYFETGRAAIEGEQAAVLDQAARLFREGNPYVMILSGATDTTGPAEVNLDLSLARARAVAEGLEARGIPVDRLQVLGRGTTDLPVETGPDVEERENRVVEITWR